MSNDNIIPKIELIQEQIENLALSGHFTEAEIDRCTAPLKMELSMLKSALEMSEAGKRFASFGFTVDEFLEANKRHNELFAYMQNIEVTDAEILTQNMEEA